MASAAQATARWVPGSSAPPAHLVIGYLLMSVGMFMAVLDIQIVASSLSQIQAGLSASPEEIVWVQSSYLIAEVIMIPLCGILGKALSTRWLFTASSLGFVVSSLLCATATTIEEMIVYRSIQGFLGGAMIPTTFATSFALFGRDRNVMVTVFVSMIVTLAPTIGPALGGVLTEYFSWHMLFLVNVVPGIIITIGVAMLLDFEVPDLSMLRRIDLPGLVLLALFLGCGEFVLEEGARKQWFEDDFIVKMAAFSGVAGVLLFFRLLTTRIPIVDLNPFRNYNFAAGTLVGAGFGLGLYSMTYLYPLYLGQVAQLSSGQIGTILSISGIAMLLAAPIAGILVSRYDPRFVASFGFMLLAVSSWQTHFLTSDWRFDQMFLPQVLRGSGLMLAMVPTATVAFGTLPPQYLKDGSGLYMLARNLGGAVGLALINTGMQWRTNFHWTRSIEHVAVSRPEVQSWIDQMTGAMDGLNMQHDASVMALKQLSLLVMREVRVMAFADCFLLMGFFFAASAIVPLLLRNPKAVKIAGDLH